MSGCFNSLDDIIHSLVSNIQDTGNFVRRNIMGIIGLVTKELKEIWKKSNDSISIFFEALDGDNISMGGKVKAKAEIVFRRKVKGFDDTLNKTFHFEGVLPKGFSKASFSFCFNPFLWGNMKALFLLIKEGDRLVFHVSDNSNNYMKNATIPSERWKDEKDRIFHPDYEGLHNDTLFVSVYRKDKILLESMELTSVQIPDNTARALRK